jgi:hypothetical protein
MGYDFVNTGKKKNCNIVWKEKLKIFNQIAYQVNTSEMFRNSPIEKDHYGCRKRKVYFNKSYNVSCIQNNWKNTQLKAFV